MSWIIVVAVLTLTIAAGTLVFGTSDHDHIVV
jgi:hypothetical protein